MKRTSKVRPLGVRFLLQKRASIKNTRRKFFIQLNIVYYSGEKHRSVNVAKHKAKRFVKGKV